MKTEDEEFTLPEDETPDEGRLVRLNKYLADHGIASRRKCDELIAKGKVTVDGAICTELGTKIDPAAQEIDVDGVVLRPERTEPRYYLLHKPRGVVCTNERREARMRAIDLITDPSKGRIYTVGRLDEESTGLILLTNDGEFANRIAHPRYGVTKTYSVRLRGRIEGEAIERVQKGVRLSEGWTAPAYVKVLKRTNEWSLVTCTLNEGKNREVRRIFASVGHNVLDLRRTHIGTLSDRTLKEGKWRPLLRAEVTELLDQSKTKSGAAGVEDRREDPRVRFFKAQPPQGPGPERRGVRSGEKYRRDRRRSIERVQQEAPTGRRGRSERRRKLENMGVDKAEAPKKTGKFGGPKGFGAPKAFGAKKGPPRGGKFGGPKGERGGARGPERGGERTGARAAERGGARGGARGPERGGARGERGGERTGARTPERGGQRGGARAPQRGGPRAGARGRGRNA